MVGEKGLHGSFFGKVSFACTFGCISMGVYLGKSPLHARSVALALHIKTGLVSP